MAVVLEFHRPEAFDTPEGRRQWVSNELLRAKTEARQGGIKDPVFIWDGQNGQIRPVERRIWEATQRGRAGE